MERRSKRARAKTRPHSLEARRLEVLAELDALVGELDDIGGRLWPERFATVQPGDVLEEVAFGFEPLEDFEPLELAPVVWLALEVGEA